MDPQKEDTSRPGAAGRVGDPWEDPPPEDDNGNGHSPADALKQLGSRLGELKEYATYYVAAKADGVKASARNLGLYAVLGIVGLMAGGAAVVTAVALMLVGLAGAISAIFRDAAVPPDRTWIGEIIVGLTILGGIGIGAMLFMKKFSAASRERTVKKYESRQQQQRVRYGHDVHERAQQTRREEAARASGQAR